MLKPKKSPLFESIFSGYSKNLLRRKFNSLNVSGLRELSEAAAHWPLLVCVNHSSWWDGIVAFFISRKLNLDSYVMMEEKQLRRYILFRRLGAFSVVRENPRKAYESVKFAAKLLNEGSKAVWVFPQGEILPNETRPFEFYRGIEKIDELCARYSVVTVSMRYEFLMEAKPDVFVRILVRNPEQDGKTLKAAKLAKEMEASLDLVGDNIKRGELKHYFNIL